MKVSSNPPIFLSFHRKNSALLDSSLKVFLTSLLSSFPLHSFCLGDNIANSMWRLLLILIRFHLISTSSVLGATLSTLHILSHLFVPPKSFKAGIFVPYFAVETMRLSGLCKLS